MFSKNINFNNNITHMTDNINEANLDPKDNLKKDNGLFDDVWDIRTQDQKQKVINTDQSVQSDDASNNDWDSLLDYYEPSRKVNQPKDGQDSKSKIDTLSPTDKTDKTKKPNKTNIKKQTVMPKK